MKGSRTSACSWSSQNLRVSYGFSRVKATRSQPLSAIRGMTGTSRPWSLVVVSRQSGRQAPMSPSIGHITVEELRRNLTETETSNGFANRFLWCCVRRSKLLPEGGLYPAGGPGPTCPPAQDRHH